jgi:acetolactate synthase-1/2/3 large subunit
MQELETISSKHQLQKHEKTVKNCSGAEAIIRSLLAEGVETIFGYPGGAIMPVYDALYDYTDKLHHILVRHEQGAAHAAQGYARVSGKAGVCLVTSGPGATNLVTGIADAMLDSTPLVCVIGQVKDSLLGTDAFQEADVINITSPITKWNYQITNADEIPEIVAKAFYIATSGRPGAVVLDITKNAQQELMKCAFKYEKCQQLVSYHPRLIPKEGQVNFAVELINQAKKPYLLVGHGVQIARAEKELITFLEKTGMPVASTLLGLSVVPTNHPQYVGMLGMHGNYGSNVLINQADLIVAIGMRFDDRVTGDVSKFAPQAKVVHIDIDPAEIGKIIKTIAPVVGDAKETLKALLPKVNKNIHAEWLSEFVMLNKLEYEKVIEKEIYPETGCITMGETIRLLADKTKGKATIVADVGQHQMIAARYSDFFDTDGYITSGGMGTMGFALPAAFGVKVAKPNRETVAIIGDGCFQMTIQELGTIAQSKLAVKIIILNNNYLGMVRQWQELFFNNRYSSVELQNPDFVAISKGFGIEAEKVTSREELSGALERMLSAKTPYLLDITVLKQHNVFPMVASGAGVSEIRLE